MTAQPEKTFLVTERPLLSLTFRQLLDSAGWNTAHVVLRPGDLAGVLAPETTALIVLDSEGGLSWDVINGLCLEVPQSRFVVWCSRVTPPLVQAAMQSGAHGLLSVRLAIPEAAEALMRIWQGERQIRFDGELQPAAAAGPCLTPREQQVVALVMEGRRNREIAETLHTTEGSVKVYMNRIFWKTGARTRHELALTGNSVLRPRDARTRSQPDQPQAADAFDSAWMFTPNQDFRSTGDVSYDSFKR